MRITSIVLALALIAPRASAQTQGGPWALCYLTVEPATSIEACTDIIESTHASPTARFDAYNIRAFAFEREGEIDRAIEDYTRMISVAGDSNTAYLAYVNRGDAYEREGRHAQAIEDYDHAVTLQPDNYPAYLGRGKAYQAQGLHDRAITDFTQAAALQPGFYDSYLGRGLSFEAKGLHDQASADYAKAISLDPARAYRGRARAYHLKGDDARALPDADKAVELAPRSADAVELRAEIYEKLGRRNEAILGYRTALKLSSEPQLSAQYGLSRLGAAGAEPPSPTSSPVEASPVQPAPSHPVQPQLLQRADWEQLPTGEEIAALYPDAARAKGIGGDTTMRCALTKDGRLADCVIVSETPAGFGFGKATLASARFFKMRPTTSDGKPVEGGTVIIPLKWALASGQP